MPLDWLLHDVMLVEGLVVLEDIEEDVDKTLLVTVQEAAEEENDGEGWER